MLVDTQYKLLIHSPPHGFLMEIQTIRTQICFLPLDNFSLGRLRLAALIAGLIITATVEGDQTAAARLCERERGEGVRGENVVFARRWQTENSIWLRPRAPAFVRSVVRQLRVFVLSLTDR